ncbi:potassium/proton antiporter [Ponticaulis sp.]|uniref:potassium/proton antiporter n=1 Tax=Ponticaulis sp. TaxID=2020902 RepID=UPI000B743927|nr:potassium/proton antiporter [Ponticaulis sp.]MAJ09584.1 potassium/proton antiporter [Ponticaulis sp.]RPG18925.1 MAG: potassium/proton antiporter [Hyphomonadaceae bacterium TMED125]HBH90637.1 potassium/proton antiporter [Hyphomonadaceae bacterium]HBJ94434.1 potassium/proton antiporter [Hyphomonadaceae bacterium]|tara:strand:- start:49171 stop:50373 length:1203 start_codon:yes stop_codon:yes gene_type:complete
MNEFIFLSSLLVFAGFLLIPLSRKLGAPILLVVLGVGMLAGEDGPGQIDFDNFDAAYALGSIALAIILYGGGVETRLNRLKSSRAPSLVLASIGVLLTAAIVGLAAHWIFNVSLVEGLLLGAVVSSTDAAATFLLIQQNRIGLKPRIENTLVLESGLNDPMAIFLTVALTAFMSQQDAMNAADFARFLPMLGLQFGLGALFGWMGGRGLAYILNRLQMPPGTYPAMALAGALIVYTGTTLLEGSGFLAIYLAGLFLRHHLRDDLIERIVGFSEAAQWLSQIALFLMLGLLVTPRDLPTTALEAALIAGVLILVARPAAVFVSMSGFGFSVREKAFISWVGLRGAVPIFLAIFPVISPGPVTVSFFNVVFVVVVISLIIQGWTISQTANWLGVKQSPEQGG